MTEELQSLSIHPEMTGPNHRFPDEPALLDLIPYGICFLDVTGVIKTYNQKCVEIWGRTPEKNDGSEKFCGALKMLTNEFLLVPHHESPVAKCLTDLRESAENYLTIERPDGSRCPVRVHVKPIFDTGKTLTGILSVLHEMPGRDTTTEASGSLRAHNNERMRSVVENHAQLNSNEERYHKMIEEVQDYAIILLDKDGIIQNWNHGAQKIKLFREEEIIGKHFRIFYLPDDRQAGLPERLLSIAHENGRAMHEGWRLRKDGSRFWGSIVITALHDAQNNIIGFTKVTRDLTERKLAEDRLTLYMKELEMQNRELEQFAYIASHDLQEPLRKIQVFSEVVHKNLGDPQVVARYFQKINYSAKRMSDLIKSVLNYSRLSTTGVRHEETDLNAILENVIGDFEIRIEEKEAVITCDVLPTLKVIPLQVTQLFANLMSNSLKFSHQKPAIKVSCRFLSKSEMKVDAPLNHDQYCEISFSDNGIGFDQQFERQIFTIFQRLHTKQEYAGTGIGLALCKKVMDNHDGFITAKSSPGAGATFLLYFPIKL
jgi:PAS domain S-box-containing protein